MKLSTTNRRNERWLHQACPFSVTLSALGNRWRAPILWKLLRGDTSFSELRRSLPLVTEKMLGQELKRLLALGLVDKHERAKTPLRVEYIPTARGRSLDPILASMYTWGNSGQCLGQFAGGGTVGSTTRSPDQSMSVDSPPHV